MLTTYLPPAERMAATLAGGALEYGINNICTEDGSSGLVGMDKLVAKRMDLQGWWAWTSLLPRGWEGPL
jgi:hypothetical protein